MFDAVVDGVRAVWTGCELAGVVTGLAFVMGWGRGRGWFVGLRWVGVEVGERSWKSKQVHVGRLWSLCCRIF